MPESLWNPEMWLPESPAAAPARETLKMLQYMLFMFQCKCWRCCMLFMFHCLLNVSACMLLLPVREYDNAQCLFMFECRVNRPKAKRPCFCLKRSVRWGFTQTPPFLILDLITKPYLEISVKKKKKSEETTLLAAVKYWQPFQMCLGFYKRLANNIVDELIWTVSSMWASEGSSIKGRLWEIKQGPLSAAL